MNIREQLFLMGDEKYKNFHSKLIPTVKPERIIGVRTPVLRKFAKDIAGTDEARSFINALPHKYYDENNLHAFIIEGIKNFNEALYETERFLPYIDNWATCDMFKPKSFGKNTDILLPYIKRWIKSEHVYTVRYAIGLLMTFYLGENFCAEYMSTVAALHSDEYYINMMIAWYFATALAKRYDDALLYLTQQRLGTWVHNKAIQKAVESSRITPETKAYLKTLKIKESSN